MIKDAFLYASQTNLLDETSLVELRNNHVKKERKSDHVDRFRYQYHRFYDFPSMPFQRKIQDES